MRTRRTIDTVIIGVVIACLAIAVVRVTIAAIDVPFVLSAAKRDAAAAKSAGLPPPKGTIASRFAASWPFGSWWGRRRPPYLGGGDYLKVVSTAQARRTLGVTVGVVGRELRQQGTPINRMLFPSDRTRLYGITPGLLLDQSDGTIVRNSWPTPAQDASFFSDIPALTKDYDPLITVAQAKTLASRAKLTQVKRQVFVAAPVPGGSGTWIVLARDLWPRRFYFVPIELSPVGGGL